MAESNLPDFDPVKFYLGVLCKRGHDWNGTGQALRYVKSGDCPACHKARYYENHEAQKQWKRQHYEANREVHSQRNKAYRKKNAERYKLWDKQRKQRDKEKISKQRSQHYLENKERLLAYRSAWYRRNKETILAKSRAYRIENREEIAQRKLFYYRTEKGKQTARRSRNKRRARKKKAHSLKYTVEQVRSTIERFKNQCADCCIGLTEDTLHLDHFIAISRGGSDVISNLLPCCQSCNSSKNNSDPKDWFQSQPFYSRKRWLEILSFLGKSDDNYEQSPSSRWETYLEECIYLLCRILLKRRSNGSPRMILLATSTMLSSIPSGKLTGLLAVLLSLGLPFQL